MSARRFFGELAVRRGFISPQQLESALSRQREDDRAGAPHKLIGQVLIEMGFLTQAQIMSVLGELEDKLEP